jgi:glycosyltransferase involved in cell wall biosynthesis
VSLLTPTYNRRAFIPRLISYILSQTYPLARMEWVILDDGTDPIEDLVAPLRSRGLEIQYIRYDSGAGNEKMTVGAKRNRLHAAARGEILVCMDDDDYYPPERVAHAVTTLRSKGRGPQICGSSRNHLYFTDDASIWSVGPYAPNHATFGTMAFTRDYARTHACDETVLHAEELSFTRRYQEPLTQLNPIRTMLVICHRNNTYNKDNLRKKGDPMIKPTSLKLRNFVASAEARAFYGTLGKDGSV